MKDYSAIGIQQKFRPHELSWVPMEPAFEFRRICDKERAIGNALLSKLIYFMYIDIMNLSVSNKLCRY